MNDEVREQIALFRYMLISPILAEPARSKNIYFREQAQKEHHSPHYGLCRSSVSAFKSWLSHYRKMGIKGLRPSPRSDCGQHRRLTIKTMDSLRSFCKAYPDFSFTMIYERLNLEGLLGDPPVSYATIARVIKHENLLQKYVRSDLRKCFEAQDFIDLWIGDFMHGPKVQHEHKLVKAILCAIIDDHTRMIVGWKFSPFENINALTLVLKNAFLTYGIPKRLYVDNGSSFRCELLVKACANLGVSLIHSKPYDAPSRGKIERFFGTVRKRFLPSLAANISLDEINAQFTSWLSQDYHEKTHLGIDQRPIDKFHLSASKIPIRRLSLSELDDLFLVSHKRSVNNDSTISFQNAVYEVPQAYIRKRIEIRHPIDDNSELYLYENNIRVIKLKLLNSHENARTFRPKKNPTGFSYAKKKVSL